MSQTSIAFASRIYDIVSRCEITRHWVDNTELADISHNLRALTQSLGEEAEDDYWHKLLGSIRRLTFALCSTPLPFNDIAVGSGIDWHKVNDQVRLCQQFYPDSHAALSALVQKLQHLSEQTYSPFSIQLASLSREASRLSVIIHDSRMHQAVSTYFAKNTSLKKARVVSARQIRETHICEVLAAIGPCKWFPDYVFSAPRAQRVHVISFRWIRDLWKPGPVFLNSSESSEDKSRKHTIGELPQIIVQPILSNPSVPSIQPLDLLPVFPPFRKIISNNVGCQPGEETVRAKLCLLSSGRAVLVSADESATQLIIDLSNTGNARVRRVPVNVLEPNLYLLLRTSGGGDFIAPLADRILGSLAEEFRMQQAEWKNWLIAAAQKQFGVLSRHELSTRISGHLNLLNGSQARPVKVRYWMSSKCIRPRKEEDFSAILAFAGLADRSRVLWEAMGLIDSAHRKAGQTIRKMLLRRIVTTSLEPLERDGEMIFDLGEQGGGTISALQISSIAEEEFEVPADRIGVLLDLEA